MFGYERKFEGDKIERHITTQYDCLDFLCHGTKQITHRNIFGHNDFEQHQRVVNIGHNMVDEMGRRGIMDLDSTIRLDSVSNVVNNGSYDKSKYKRLFFGDIV